MKFENPGPKDICKLLGEVHTIAVVGLSPNMARPSFGVAKAMQSFGYRIFPVRPLITEVLGEKAYPDLESLPKCRTSSRSSALPNMYPPSLKAVSNWA